MSYLVNKGVDKSVIVFDWDGTLFDSMSYKRDNLCATFSTFSGASDELIKVLHARYTGLPRRILFEHIAVALRGNGLSEQEFSALSLDYTERNIKSSHGAKPFPDALYAIPLLQASGLKLYVSSSSNPEELRKVVGKSDLAGSFEGIFGSEQNFNKGKEHLHCIAVNQRVALTGILFVGDDAQDEVLGAQAGVDTIRIIRNNGKEKLTNNCVIESLVTLTEALGAANEKHFHNKI